MDSMANNTYFDDAFPEHPRRDGGPFGQWLTADSPWDPMGASGQANPYPPPSVPQSSSTSHAFNSRAAQTYAGFNDWRSTGLPSASDCETVPGADSGYGGSLMPSNIDSTSIQGDDRINASIPDVETELGGFHLTSHDTQAGHQLLPDAAGDFSTSPSPEGNTQVCKECNLPMRTKSEMNKHLQRHRKPHTCSYTDCSRQTNGFASNNDLVRHKRTVHGELANGRNFVCHHDPCNKKELKLWPRADNFRSHLQRVHKLKVKAEDDLRDYVHQQQQQSQDLEGIGTNLQDPESLDEESARIEYVSRRGHITDFSHISPPVQVTAQVSATMQAYDQNFLVPPQSHSTRPRHHLGRPAGPRNFQHPAREDMKPVLPPHSHTSPFQQPSQQNHGTVLSPTNSRIHSSPVENHSPRQSASANASIQAESDSEEDEEEDDEEEEEEEESKESVVSSSVNGSQSLQAVIEQLKDTKPAEQVEYLKQFSKDILQQALESQSQSMDESNDSSQSSSKPNTACSTCEKTFNRPCELRKHNKRHEKPYGCTWYQCNRTFGSKNDWKRHETNQHGQIETWNCPHDCLAAYNSREMFSKHLQNVHDITDAAILERNIEESRQGSHCTKKFWCGFCNTLQTIATADGITVANQRFDHIDHHFMGRKGLKKMKIEEWQHMEDQADDIDHSTSKKNHLPEAEGDVGRKSKRQRAN